MKHKHILLIISVLVLCLQACKTDPVKPVSKITVIGKWYIAQHDLKLIRDGVQVGETTRTNYTKDDFAIFFEDGTGYQSAQGTSAIASLSEFHYILKDSIITLFVDGGEGEAETITRLTETELAIHYESKIPDLYVAGKFNTEIDDYAFKR